MYGIFHNEVHIGNILIDGLQSVHRYAEIGYVIGDKDYWGKNIASFAISKVIEIAKNDYNLKKLVATCSCKNIASSRCLEKNNFVLEGRKKSHVLYGKEWQDQLDYGLLL